jgi:hypothetical protein
MAIQNEMPYGGTGWHGDQAVSLRSTIGDLQTLSNDIHDQWTAVVGELDTSGDLAGADVTYALTAPTVEAANFALQTLIHVAQGGSYVHGDNAVMLREFLAGVVAVGNEVYAHLGAAAGPGLLNDLDGAGGLGDVDYGALWSPVDGTSVTDTIATAGRGMHPRFANGREASHGDQGVQVRLALEEMVAVNNTVKEVVNGVIAKLDADTSTGTYAPFAITAPDVA